MSHLPLSLMNRLNKTESAVFTLWMLCFLRIFFPSDYYQTDRGRTHRSIIGHTPKIKLQLLCWSIFSWSCNRHDNVYSIYKRRKATEAETLEDSATILLRRKLWIFLVSFGLHWAFSRIVWSALSLYSYLIVCTEPFSYLIVCTEPFLVSYVLHWAFSRTL